MTPEDNELLTRVGPGTPMGALLRRYWLPLLDSETLGPPDGAPRRMRLLGEDLVVFRDTLGRAGLLAEACPHRGASLFFGRNEQGGLRCVYHGWKFDVAGQCTDMPTEPAESGLRRGPRTRAHACREQNGIVWAYLGPPEQEPAQLPGLGWAAVPASRRTLLTYQRRCNWVQALEGDVDTAHLAWLHSRFDAQGEREVAFHDADRLRDAVVRDPCPALEVADTSAGVVIAARRHYDASRHYWRISQFQMPFFTSVPAIGRQRRAKAWIPMDDEHTLVWEANWSPSGQSGGQDEARKGRIPESGMLPEGADPLSRGRFAAGRENDYRIDRARQRNGNFTGIEESPPLQDAAVQESMGPIVDRSREHLGTSDLGIIRVRQRLLEAARRLRDRGGDPPGVLEPEAYRLHGCQMLLERGADWRAASPEEQEEQAATGSSDGGASGPPG